MEKKGKNLHIRWTRKRAAAFGRAVSQSSCKPRARLSNRRLVWEPRALETRLGNAVRAFKWSPRRGSRSREERRSWNGRQVNADERTILCGWNDRGNRLRLRVTSALSISPRWGYRITSPYEYAFRSIRGKNSDGNSISPQRRNVTVPTTTNKFVDSSKRFL